MQLLQKMLCEILQKVTISLCSSKCESHENGFVFAIMNTSRTDLVEARMTEVDERYALRRSDG